MAVLTKAQLDAEIDTFITTNGTGEITGSILNALLKNFVDSYQDYVNIYTTVERDALTGLPTPYIIYNSTNQRLEFYNGSASPSPAWFGIGMTRHESPLYLKASGNTNLTTDQNNDWRLIESGGNLVYQKYVAGVWTEMAAIAG